MKVRANKVHDDGIVFDSGKEHARYCVLKLLQRAGEISKLQVHPTFTFIVAGMEVGKYRPDFVYHASDGSVKVEDVKGWKRGKSGRMLPRVEKGFPTTKKLMKALFALDVEVV